MNMSSQIAFERAWAKANRLPTEQAAIAPTGQAAYAHGIAEGEEKNRAAAFASDMTFRKEAATEKGREFEQSGAERARQTTEDLEQRYGQATKSLDERGRQFGGRLSFSEESFGKTIAETGRQFDTRLTTSGGQFDKALEAKRSIFESSLAESVYESGMIRGQKATQFEMEFAFKAKSFDDEMAWNKDKFASTLSFQDQQFMDKMSRQRRDLDTWILNSKIGSVIQLANTVVSAYGMKRGIEERRAMNAELIAARESYAVRGYNRASDAAEFDMIQDANNAYKIPKYDYDPDAVMKGNYYISDPEPVGTMNVSRPITYSDFAKSYDRMRVTPRTYKFLSP